MKSTTKLILAGLGTAAVCAGVYYVIKNKDKSDNKLLILFILLTNP